MKIPEILRYLRIVRKWWWVVTLFVAATVGTLLVLAYLTEANYEATVTMYVSAPPPQEVPLYSKFGQQALRDEIEQTRISLNEFLKYCKDKGIETPEERKEKRDRIQKKKEEQERKMMEDEAAWHAEQQKIDDKRHKEIEEEAKKRKQRLQKFGFK